MIVLYNTCFVFNGIFSEKFISRNFIVYCLLIWFILVNVDVLSIYFEVNYIIIPINSLFNSSKGIIIDGSTPT